ncbi:phenylalanine N-monooxygenase-like [Typha angustifolia]|uniref:phenylalanine N-monooxygenase-like n=1 Tax=Typha angustifolia TaxID=59011 RepID=UPI003C2CA571
MVTNTLTLDTILPVSTLLFLTFLILFLHSLPFQPKDKATMTASRRLPPGPTPLPVAAGNLLTMLNHSPCFRWVLTVSEKNDITCIRLGGTHVIVVNCPVFAREFLKKHDATFASRPLTMATEYASRGYLSTALSPWGDQWKKMRRVIASEVLAPARLRLQSSLREEEADHLVKYVHNHCENTGKVIDIRRAARYYSGNMIRRMMLGVRHLGAGGEHGGPGEEEVEHVEAAFEVLSMLYAFCPSDFVPSLRYLDLGGHEKRMKEATRVIHKYHDPLIDEKLKKRRGGKEEGEEAEDIIDVLVSLKASDGSWLLTGEEIKGQAAELVYATVDNPSNTVEWALAELLNQPDLLQKAVDELDRVVGLDRLVKEADFPHLPYIKAVAREALRLHPVTAFNLPHVAMADATVAGYFIPKGSQVLLSRVGLGRNPKVWTDPLRFNPDRHLEDGSGKVELAEPDLRFISFTTGRRGCMGAALGSVMTYMLLARLLQAFQWSPAPGDEPIDLSEEKKSLCVARPLRAFATPRMKLLADM